MIKMLKIQINLFGVKKWNNQIKVKFRKSPTKKIQNKNVENNQKIKRVSIWNERVRRNSVAYPPQHAVCSEREGGWSPGFLCQGYPRLYSAISVGSLPPKRNLRKANYSPVFFGKWLMVNFFPAGSRSLAHHSPQPKEKTQFCLMQPFIYYCVPCAFSSFDSSLDQSFDTLKDYSFF